jgi:4-amino-4-deoxy-L-arabinose transferase-like glycosyltransferase
MDTPTPLTHPPQVAARPRAEVRWWHLPALGGVLLMASGLHLYALEQAGYGNLYYAATVRSMLSSWHNVFYASFDPGGFVTVDKPPLGLWVQAASTLVFGFNGWALMFPQALAGVLSVAVLYRLVRRTFGAAAGLLAALVLALMPVSIAANRNNTMDSQLVFTSLLAAWAFLLAAEQGRLRLLLAGALLVGIGFNIKMLQAVMVLPAFYLVYLLAPVTWWKKILHLGLATVVLAVVSLAWAVAVDFTPAGQRPFIGSSTDNTVMELIVGHNGAARLGQLGRIVGLRGTGLGGARPPAPDAGLQPGGQNLGAPGQPLPGVGPQAGNSGQPPLGVQPQNGPPPQPPGDPSGGLQRPADGPGQGETGQAGLFRLFNEQLAGQASWLLPLALLGIAVLAWQVRVQWPLAREHLAVLLWAAWLVPMIVFFSFAGLFHRYYLEMMSPAIAALTGGGLVALWHDYREHSRRGWLLPLALVGSAAGEVFILHYFPEQAAWLTPPVAGLTLLAAGALVLLKMVGLRPWAAPAAAVGAFALLLAPAAWTLMPVLGRADAGLPFAGPSAGQRRGGAGLPDVSALAAYLTAHRSGEKWLAATLNANTAAPLILATGEPVMALGGFTGSDQILRLDELAALVEKGEVRFFLVPRNDQRPGGAPGPNVGDSGPGGPARLAPGNNTGNWVRQNCTPVDSRLWQSAQGGAQPQGPGGPTQLYDCRR